MSAREARPRVAGSTPRDAAETRGADHLPRHACTALLRQRQPGVALNRAAATPRAR